MVQVGYACAPRSDGYENVFWHYAGGHRRRFGQEQIVGLLLPHGGALLRDPIKIHAVCEDRAR